MDLGHRGEFAGEDWVLVDLFSHPIILEEESLGVQ